MCIMNLSLQNLSLLARSYLLESLCETGRRHQIQSGDKLWSEEQQTIKRMITELSADILEYYSEEQDITIKAEALIALMDAREIGNTEKELQQALEFAERLLPQMAGSPLKCKLLSYCYYYIEEPECAKEASRIIESWDKTQYTPEMREAIECYNMLI